MAGESREGPSIPFSGIIGVGLVAATIIAKNVDLDSARLPPQEPRRAVERFWLQKVETRMWQDPMTAVVRYRELERAAALQRKQLGDTGAAESPAPPGVIPPDHRHEISSIVRTPAQEALCDGNEEVRIVAPMILGGQSEEDAEMRRRTRYAVVSALMNAGYVPDNADALGYAYAPSQYREDYYTRLPETIPFEWFRKELPPAAATAATTDEGTTGSARAAKSSWILVLWLDQSLYYVEPLGRLRKLVKVVSPQCSDGSIRILPTTVIGPVDTDAYKTLVSDMSRDGGRKADDGVAVPLTIVSASATGRIDVEQLAHPPGMPPPTQHYYRQSSPAGDTLLVRMIGTDDRLLQALRKELGDRNLEPGSLLRRLNPATPVIVVVNEPDTDYGRHFGAIASDRVKSFAYLRQIDGGGATSPSPRAAQSGQAAPAAPKGQPRSHGTNHVDYLTRLVDSISEYREAGQRDVVAIGIFGSDAYDKLLVLRALKPAFPKALFVTTDLDARLLDPDERKWTGNLVVASNYDLKAHPTLQKGAAPFRDSYQTATYIAARIVAGDCLKTLKPDELRDPKWLGEPLLFELGRTRAVPLQDYKSDLVSAELADCLVPPDAGSAAAPKEAPAAMPRDGLVVNASYGAAANARANPVRDERRTPALRIQPELTRPAPPVAGMASSAAIGLLALLVAPLAFGYRSGPGALRLWARDRFGTGEQLAWAAAFAAAGILVSSLAIRDASPQGSVIGMLIGMLACLGCWALTGAGSSSPWVARIGVLLLMPAAVLLALAVHPIVTGNAEPFEWIEGVSVWPTQLMRAGGSVFALFALCFVSYIGARDARAIESAFRLDQPGARGLEHTLSHYVRQRRWRLPAATLLAFVYLMVCFAIIMKFDEMPGMPVRGEDNLYRVQLMLGLVVFASLALLLTVALAYRAFIVHAIRPAKTGVLRLHAAREYERAHGLPDTSTARDGSGIDRGFVDLVIAVRLVAERTRTLTRYIYFPFALFALIIVARSPLFDMWDTPVSLRIILVLPFVIVIGCVVWLRHETLLLHRSALREMEDELIRLRGTGLTDAQLWQLERLHDQVKNENRGSFQNLALQPLIRALLLPIGGFSGIELLEHVVLR